MNTQEVDPAALLELIRSEPDAKNHISFDAGEWWVTNEWLSGGFAGRAFTGATQEEAALKLIGYLNLHMKHDSWVGEDVDRSGWPDLQKVKAYLESKRKEDSPELHHED